MKIFIDKFTLWLNQRKTVYLLMLVAFIIRAGFGLALGTRFLPMADQIAFDELARNLATGKGLLITERLILPSPDMPPDIRQRYFSAPERMRDLRLNALWGVIRPDTPTAFFEPLVPIVFGIFYKVVGPSLLAPRIFQSLLDALVVGMLFSIGTMAFPRSRTPGIAALVYDFYPFSIMFTGALITQPIYLFLQCTTIYTFYRFMITPCWENALLFALTFGLTILTRVSLLTFAPLFLLALFVQDFARPKWFPATVSIVLAGFLLLPWVLRNSHSLGTPLLLPTKGGRNLWEYNNQVFSRERLQYQESEGIDILYQKFARKYLNQVQGRQYIEFPEFTNESEIERDQVLNHNVQQFIKLNPGIYARLCFLRLYQYFRITPSHHPGMFFKLASWASFGWIFPLSIIGAILLWRWWRKTALLYLLILYNVVVHSLTASGIPHRLPIDPYLILFAAFTLNWLFIKLELLSSEVKESI